MLRCTEGNCDQEAVFLVWFINYGNIYTYRCKDHLIWLLQTSPYEVAQVSRAEIALKAGWSCQN